MDKKLIWEKTSFAILLWGMILFISCQKEVPTGVVTGFQAGPILFISDRSGKMQLYSMNADGSDVKQLTNDQNFPITSASWSPNGKKIAFTSPVGGFPIYGPALYVMNADGTDRTLLTKPRVGDPEYATGCGPVWSPDSKKLAFWRYIGPEYLDNREIFTIAIDGTEETRITTTSDTAETVTSWSNDGATLLATVTFSWRDSTGNFVSVYQINILNLRGQYLKTVERSDRYITTAAVYSSSGGKIAYSSYTGGVYKAYNIVATDTGLTFKTLITQNTYFWNYPVSWSSDDSKILYTAYQIGGGPGRILIVDLQALIYTDITPFPPLSLADTLRFSALFAVSWRRN